MDVGGQSDPYVKIFLQPLRDECSKTYETRVVLKTLSPVFEECFIFTVNVKVSHKLIKRA